MHFWELHFAEAVGTEVVQQVWLERRCWHEQGLVIVYCHTIDYCNSEVVYHMTGHCCSERMPNGLQKEDQGYARAHQGHPIALQIVCCVQAVVCCVQVAVCCVQVVVYCVLVAGCCVTEVYLCFRSSRPIHQNHEMNDMQVIEMLYSVGCDFDWSSYQWERQDLASIHSTHRSSQLQKESCGLLS